MRNVVQKIDQAIKRLYGLDHEYRAEEFLIFRPWVTRVSRGIALHRSVRNCALQGALFIRETQSPPSEISLGIYLSEGVRRRLSAFRSPTPEHWTWEELDAFSVAVEEVSHFEYLIHHATSGRQVSQLELEIQGEIDKFLVTYFAWAAPGKFDGAKFDALFEQFFFHFRLAERLSAAETERYLEANRLARRFIRRLRGEMERRGVSESVLRELRRFYRAGGAEKISRIGL